MGWEQRLWQELGEERQKRRMEVKSDTDTKPERERDLTQMYPTKRDDSSDWGGGGERE